MNLNWLCARRNVQVSRAERIEQVISTMRKLHSLVLFLLAAQTATYAMQRKPDSSISAIKQGANRVAKATIAGDWTTVADSTYGKVVEQMGGRQKMLSDMKIVMTQLKEQGMAITSFNVGTPGEPVSDGGRIFSVVPVSVELSGQKGKLHSKGYLLAISEDKGKSWKYVDGSGMANKTIKEKIFPKLPAKLKLPEIQKPVFEPKK